MVQDIYATSDGKDFRFIRMCSSVTTMVDGVVRYVDLFRSGKYRHELAIGSLREQ